MEQLTLFQKLVFYSFIFGLWEVIFTLNGHFINGLNFGFNQLQLNMILSAYFTKLTITPLYHNLPN